MVAVKNLGVITTVLLGTVSQAWAEPTDNDLMARAYGIADGLSADIQFSERELLDEELEARDLGDDEHLALRGVAGQRPSGQRPSGQRPKSGWGSSTKSPSNGSRRSKGKRAPSEYLASRGVAGQRPSGRRPSSQRPSPARPSKPGQGSLKKSSGQGRRGRRDLSEDDLEYLVRRGMYRPPPPPPPKHNPKNAPCRKMGGRCL